MDSHINHVMTLSNSIIGVGVLAMPFCFKQCGIVLSIILLIFSSIFSRLACHFLLKSSIMTRRRTFEFLAFHTFGGLGKFVVEIGIIGFLIGTCIAFFVIMGDLAPAIIAKISDTKTTHALRTTVLVIVAVCCILPLGLLKNVGSLSSVCTATIGFYFFLVLKIVLESVPHIISGDWIGHVELWRPDGILQCLPIFSMALFCQTQLFEIYDSIPNASLDKMNDLIRKAVNICTCLYIFVGMFGYIAFYNQTLTGNILMRFLPSLMTDLMKIGFVLSVAFSFPLVIFPCRASLYSLLYKQGNVPHDIVSQTRYIPQNKFVIITIGIVLVSLIIAILIPNIELVLGLVGSTIGVMICILFPATTFVCVSTKNTNERILAQIMLCIGIIVMVLGTYANLYAIEKIETNPMTEKIIIVPLNNDNLIHKVNNLEPLPQGLVDMKNRAEKLDIPPPAVDENKNGAETVVKEIRHEPPQPEAPADFPKEETVKKDQIQQVLKEKAEIIVPPSVATDEPAKKREEVDIEAIKKEDNELRENEKNLKNEEEKKQGELMKTLEKHKMEQKHLLHEQERILDEMKMRKDTMDKIKQNQDVDKVKEEKIKALKQIQDIAEKAIESIKLESDNKAVNDVPNNDKEPAEIQEIAEKAIESIKRESVNEALKNNVGPPVTDAAKKQPTLQDIIGVPVKESEPKREANVNVNLSQDLLVKDDRAKHESPQQLKEIELPMENDKQPADAAAPAGARDKSERDNLRRKRNAVDIAEKVCDKNENDVNLSKTKTIIPLSTENAYDFVSDNLQDVLMQDLISNSLKMDLKFKSKRK